MSEYQALNNQIANAKAQVKQAQEELEELEATKKRLLEIDNISHSDAVDKLREIWEDANRSESERDFIIGVIQDKQLKEWFGPVDTGW